MLVGSRGLFRVGPDGVPRPFLRTAEYEFTGPGGPGEGNRIRGAAFDPRFGLAVSGYGRAPGLSAGSGFVAVFNLDGTPRTAFRQHVRLGGASGQGWRNMAWDHAGRLLVGGMSMDEVNDLRDDSEGRLNDDRYIRDGPPPGNAHSVPVLEGFPTTMWTVRRLLPDGSIDSDWSKALWFDRPAFRLAVLPNNDAIVWGTFERGIGAQLPSSVRLAGERPAWRPPQQSVRGRVEHGGPPLILGLVLEGDRATDVLIRAMGPSLRQFDVPDPAGSLRLTVYRGAERVVSGGVGTSTPPVRWTAQRVGAFPSVQGALAEPHRLLQLFPEIDTFHVETERPSGNGTALAEVYYP